MIGDWSSDGHGKSDTVLLESNKTVREIQEAYKKSCKLTGLSFNHNDDYTGLKLPWNHPEAKERRIAVEYGDNTISKLAEEILLKHGIDVWDGFDKSVFTDDDVVYIDGPDHFIELWIKFVQLSLPDLVLEKVTDDIPVINGWWNENLNVQFGYGLYGD